jgi:hypothetical protein
LGGSGGKCSVYSQLVSNMSPCHHHTTRSLERAQAMCFTHASVWMHCICYGALFKERLAWCKGHKGLVSKLLRGHQGISTYVCWDKEDYQESWCGVCWG